MEPDPDKRGREVEQTGQHVLPLDCPRDRLGVDGVDGEYRGDEQRSRHSESPEDAPQEERVRQVQQHIDGVVTGRGEPPHLVLQPERGVGHRPVERLLHLVRPEPEAQDARPFADSCLAGNVVDVVPHETTPQHRRQVADQHQERQGQHRQHFRGTRAAEQNVRPTRSSSGWEWTTRRGAPTVPCRSCRHVCSS